MSYRSNAVSKEFLLLNVPDSSIHFPREENIITEYKRLFNEKKTLEKELDIILYVKKKGILTPIKTKLLRQNIEKIQSQLRSIEESSVLRPLIEREKNAEKRNGKRKNGHSRHKKLKRQNSSLLKPPLWRMTTIIMIGFGEVIITNFGNKLNWNGEQKIQEKQPMRTVIRLKKVASICHGSWVAPPRV